MGELFIVSEELNSEFEAELLRRGEVIKLSSNVNLSKAESRHADMQFFKIGESSVVVSPDVSGAIISKIKSFGIDVTLGSAGLCVEYPENIKFNILKAGKSLFHNFKHTDEAVLKYAEKEALGRVFVKQGYCACTSMYFEFCNLILTGDNGIIKAAERNNYGVCVFSHSEEIELAGFDHGFIGGSGVVLDGGKTVIFNGNFSGNYPRLADELSRREITVIDCGRSKLCDIGGVISLTY